MGNSFAAAWVGNQENASPFHGASNMTFTNTTINVAGRDITHTEQGRTKGLSLQELLDFIPRNQFRMFQMDNLAKRAKGTGAWFLDEEDYKDWKKSDGGILWGTGIPGAGKTVLASIVIDDLQKLADDSPDTSVAFAYCRYTDEMSVKDILFALLRQQLERKPQVASIIGPMLSRHKLEKTEPSQEELVEILKCIAKQFKKNFYNIDGLDESKDDVQFDLITTLASVKANFFITSRPLENLKSALPMAKLFTITANGSDLEQFVVQQIEKTPKFRTVLDNHGLRKDVIRKVRENARGMFLHAVLQIETLKRCLNSSQLEGELDKVPLEIGDLYSTSLGRIGNQYPEYVAKAKDLLLWVLYAERPLTIDELQYALAFCPGPEPFDQGRLIPEDVLVSLCCGLVTVDRKSKQVRLIHYTAKDVLQRLLKPEFPHPHELLATTCIARLASCQLQNSTVENRVELNEVIRRNALLGYSLAGWIPHLRHCEGESPVWDLASEFIWACRAFPWQDWFTIDRVQGMHLIARYDLWRILDRVPPADSKADLQHWPATRDANARSKLGYTPLIIASQLSHGASVRRLLQVPGIEVNRTDGQGKTALVWAVYHNNEDIVGQLLDVPGVEVNHMIGEGKAALVWAAYRNNEGMVRRLLEAPGIAVNLADGEGKTALIWAVYRGNLGIVQRLLEVPGVEVNRADDKGRTALLWAVDWGDERIVRELLGVPGIEVAPVDDEGKTALIWAAACANVGIVRQLLQVAGTEVNLRDGQGNSALIWAVRNGNEGVVRELLEVSGIDVNLADKERKTALIWAAFSDNEAIVRLLLEVPGMEVNLTDDEGYTALMWAVFWGKEGMVRLLLRVPGVEVNLTDDEGNTALIWAVVNRNEGIVRRLLECPGIQVNLTDYWGNTALIWAAYQGHEGIMRALLDSPGMQPSRVDTYGRTALMVASAYGRRGAVHLLLTALGAEHDITDEDDRTALILTSDQGYGAIVQLLCDADLADGERVDDA